MRVNLKKEAKRLYYCQIRIKIDREGCDVVLRKNIEIDKDILRNNKIPLLCKDPDWIDLFGQVEDKKINEIKFELEGKLSRELEIEKLIKDMQDEKTQCMKMILGISDSVNNSKKKGNIKLLDEYREKIESINEEIDDLMFESETLPKEIRELNLNLLRETIRYGYDELSEKEEILKESLEEIDILREKMKSLIKIKYDYGDWINNTYTFFHGLLGSEVIEKIDQERLR